MFITLHMSTFHAHVFLPQNQLFYSTKNEIVLLSHEYVFLRYVLRSCSQAVWTLMMYFF